MNRLRIEEELLEKDPVAPLKVELELKLDH